MPAIGRQLSGTKIASQLKVPATTDVSCGGADTTHLQTSQATPAGYVPPQLDALSKKTDLVTVGIGANDFGVFAALFATCPSLRATDPKGAPCKKRFATGGKDQLEVDITQTKARLTTMVKTIKTRTAPKATVVLVGYTMVAPAKTTCAELPLAKGDYAYLNATITNLNKAIAAAKTGGAKYVDVYQTSTGHDVCAKDKAWIQGKDPDLLKAAAFHPRAVEQAAVAALVMKALKP